MDTLQTNNPNGGSLVQVPNTPPENTNLFFLPQQTATNPSAVSGMDAAAAAAGAASDPMHGVVEVQQDHNQNLLFVGLALLLAWKFF